MSSHPGSLLTCRLEKTQLFSGLCSAFFSPRKCQAPFNSYSTLMSLSTSTGPAASELATRTACLVQSLLSIHGGSDQGAGSEHLVQAAWRGLEKADGNACLHGGHKSTLNRACHLERYPAPEAGDLFAAFYAFLLSLA